MYNNVNLDRLSFTFQRVTVLFIFIFSFGLTHAQSSFITTWVTDDETIHIPTGDGLYDYTLTYKNLTDPNAADGALGGLTGDYTISNLQNGDTYQVEISGDFPHFWMNNDATHKDKLMTIEHWGDIVWESMERSFYGCSNLTYNATDAPNLANEVSMAFMFANCSDFNGDVSSWDVSNVTDMSRMFQGVDNLPNFSSWDVSSVTNMSSMFRNVIDFNEDISLWDVSAVNDMMYMFYGAETFDGDLSLWNVSNVIYMNNMFYGASSFNGDIDSWNVSNVTTMAQMFENASSFNRDLNSWNVSNVTNMSLMFAGASSFNGDISAWDVSIGPNINAMFRGATSFNQDLSLWDVSNVTGMNSTFENTALSYCNYDAMLEGWSQQALQDEVNFDAGKANYTNQEARDELTNTFNWVVSDGGELFLNINETNPVSCAGAADGELTATTPGIPYTYQWLDGDENAIAGENDTILSNIGPGDYYFQIAANGCMFTEGPYTMTEPSGITTVDFEVETDGFEVSFINLSSPADVDYQWYFGDGNVSTGENPIHQYEDDGNYEVCLIVSDDCENIEICKDINVESPCVNNPVTIDFDITNSACGENNGAIDATLYNTTGSFYIYWSNGAQNALSISDLAPGDYYLNVIDENGCVVVKQGNVLSESINVNANIEEVSCSDGNDGSISLDISGGASPYTVLWSNGKTQPTISDLRPGIYEAVITDETGCEVVYSYTLENPQPFSLTYTTTPPSDCNTEDGAIEFANAENATGMISYNWSTGETTPSLNDIRNGIYNVTATDDLGCQSTRSFNFNESGDVASLSANVRRTDCYESSGSIELMIQPSAGESVSDISWSNDETTQNIFDLDEGYYEVEVTQTNGCISKSGWDVGIRMPERPEICVVTVDDETTTNMVVWEKEETHKIDSYTIYRETSSASVYEPVGSVDYDEISVFNDVIASPKRRSWRYRIAAVNHCGVEGNLSRAHKTMHLTTTTLNDNEFRIRWDNYEGRSFATYNLWRYTDEFDWELIEEDIDVVNLPSYTDTPPSLDSLDYFVEIEMGFTCTATFGKAQDYNSTRSNKSRGVFNPGEGTGDPNNSLVSNENPNFDVNLYPNPNDGQFTIDVALTQGDGKPLQAMMMDMTGKMVQNSTINQGSNELSLEDVESGMYLIQITDGEYKQLLRVVKR